MASKKRSHAIGGKPRKKTKRQRVVEIKATIAHLKTLQGLRAKGAPVSYTSDPAWLVNEAINRRAGWVEDPGTRGTTQPVQGKLPRKATGQWQDDYYRAARDVNTPRLIVRPQQIGPARKELLARMPERFTYPENEERW